MADSTLIEAENLLRIMVATDNHLGYAEKDVIRGEDSFVAFEEILQMAVVEDVDFILLGGDLFHDTEPTQNSLYKCMELLRRYTFGDKPVSFEVLGDQTEAFHNSINHGPNYMDPNLNISIPVFSIHGNHDDVNSFGRLSALDLFSTTGLVNYFGRWTDLTKVEINPIPIRKGETNLALYGLSHLHDSRLNRLFDDYKVTMNRPSEGEWFNLMVVHQNRADRGPKNYLPEEVLPKYLNLVIWGHEHDCRIVPEYNEKQDFYVSQPGSSVATSLSEGESLNKHVGILEIYKNKFQLKKMPLKTVRPFIFESVDLTDYVDELKLDECDAASKVWNFALERVEAMIERAKDLLTGHPKQPKLPLIRLRLLYRDEKYMFNAIRFAQSFSNRVANTSDVVHFKKIINRTKKGNDDNFDHKEMAKAFDNIETTSAMRVEELVQQYFEEFESRNTLKVMPAKALAEITHRLVVRKDTYAADYITKFYKEKCIEHLMETLPNDEEIEEEIKRFGQQNDFADMLKVIDEKDFKYDAPSSSVSMNLCHALKDDKDVSIAKNTTRSTRGRGRGRGASTRGTTSRAKNAMPPLDVTVNKTRASRQQSSSKPAATSSRKPIYVSDDSD